MKLSWIRIFQWTGILAVLVFVAALRYEAPSEAGMQMNAPPESPLSQSLRGYWKLDDGSGTNATDASGNGNTLAMTGSPSWATGQIGLYSLTFSGSGQYLSVADPASGVLDFPNGTNFSLSGWFNRSAFAADHTIIAKKNDQTTGAGYVVWVDNNGSTDYLFFEASDGTHTYQIQSTTDFSATGWHHFAITWNDSATTNPVNLYIDGKLDNGATSGTFSSVTDLSNALAFRIGAESDAGVPFAGSLDDIRIYGYALGADQVKKVYNTSSPTQPIDTSLVGHWTFDGTDVQGTTAIDRSSFGNNGTITGTTKTIGKLGQALSFNGTSNYVSIPDSSLWTWNPGTETRSVTAWVMFTSLSGSPVILGDNGSDWYHFGYYTSLDVLSFYDGNATYIGSNASLSVGTWYFLSWVINSGTTYFYKDGSSLGSDGPVANVSRDPSGLAIGSTNGGSFFSGQVDDVRIYNRALSATEIASMYMLGK